MLVTVVGAGALGSHFVQFFRNEACTIKIIDFDRVEQRNVASQFHSKAGVGKKKTASLQQSLKFLYGREIISVSNKLTKDNVKELLSNADLIVDCLDNGASRRLVQDFARSSQTPCLHGALSANGDFGRVVWDELFVIDDESVQGAPTCEGGDFLPFIGIASSFLAKSAQAFLSTGKKGSFSISPSRVEKF